MSKSYKKSALIGQVKFYLQDAFACSKYKILIFALIMLVFLIMGIVLGVSYNSETVILQDYGIVSFIETGKTTSFFMRILSVLLIMLMLFGFSFKGFLMPFALLILSYRAYLLGFNLCLLFLGFGLGGIILALLVILPCQLAILAILIFYYCMCNNVHCKNQYCGKGGMWKIFFIVLLVAAVICLVEALLLLIFNANIIIVI